MGTVLLFNISDLRKIAIIRLLAYRYGIRLLEVDPEQQNQTIDRLLKDPDGKALPCPDPFQDEMMVMHDLSGEAFHAAELRRASGGGDDHVEEKELIRTGKGCRAR